jgi:SecD/SecF fusion protein
MIFSMFSFINLLGFCLELNQIFIGSLLTIIGYSINDTVVVFDRIREKLLINKEKNIKNLINLFNSAINETMSRTIITSLTTLAVVLILFLFGGEDLKNFSFTLLIGILFGTYSSIFIAVPVSIDLYFYKSIKKNKFF